MSGKANTACLYTISSCQISTLENEAGSVGWLFEEANCTARQCSPLRRKIYGVLYNQASSIVFDETSSYWSVLKSS